MLALLVALAPCCMSRSGKEPRRDSAVIVDYYLTPTTRHLMWTPPASAALLSALLVTGVAPPKPIREEASAINSFLNWLVLKRDFLPPKNAAFVPFPLESGAFDVVRARYPTRLGLIDVAQTKHIESIRVYVGDSEGTDSCLARADDMANELFHTSVTFDFVPVGVEGDMVFGKQREVPAGDLMRWDMHTRCWCTPGRIGFLFAKRDGYWILITPHAEDNVSWFRAYSRLPRLPETGHSDSPDAGHFGIGR